MYTGQRAAIDNVCTIILTKQTVYVYCKHTWAVLPSPDSVVCSDCLLFSIDAVLGVHNIHILTSITFLWWVQSS